LRLGNTGANSGFIALFMNCFRVGVVINRLKL